MDGAYPNERSKKGSGTSRLDYVLANPAANQLIHGITPQCEFAIANHMDHVPLKVTLGTRGIYCRHLQLAYA